MITRKIELKIKYIVESNVYDYVYGNIKLQLKNVNDSYSDSDPICCAIMLL